MIKHMPISETRKHINQIADDLPAEDTISVTNRGKEVLAIIPWETYEAMMETFEILCDDKLMSDLKKGLQDVDKNKLHDLDAVKKDLGLV